MADDVRDPAKRPCASCPYRRDVPSGVWEPDEYAKLPAYDQDTLYQPPALFLCHQQDGRVCAGWAGCHDMSHSLALRLAISMGLLTDDQVTTLLDYETDVPLHPSGQAAHDHGVREVAAPSDPARDTIRKIITRRTRRREATP